jgi:general secretion pathway protein A
LIYAASQGNPRRINSVCDRALLIAYTKEQFTVSKKIIKKAIRDIYGNQIEPISVEQYWSRYSPVFILILVLIVAGFLVFSYGEKMTPWNAKNEKKVKTTPDLIKKIEDKKPPKKIPSLFLDEKRSISRLFTLFYSKTGYDKNRIHEMQVKFVNYRLDPEYYVMLKRPFRVSIDNSGDNAKYMVIDDTGEETAVALDVDGGSRVVSRDFILDHWGGDVSWIYPMETKTPVLYRGMNHDAVYDLQKALNQIGYLVELTGIYDNKTVQAITRFQKDFGLLSDGIAGPETRALLYQMVG